MHTRFSVLALLVVQLASASRASAADPPKPFSATPTPQQIGWQRLETTLFIHFGINTFTDREWGDGTEDPHIFQPRELDATQWARAAKAGGFRLIILTAKHHDGFCLWPSKYTDHSVRSSPWRDGRGDVVREFVDACRKEGLKAGLYLSPWDRHEKTYGDSPRYNDFYVNQLTELLTNYGTIHEVWFDGACGEGPNGKRQEYDWPRYISVIRKLQPDAVIFSDAGPDVRWIGNEQGIAGDPCWSTVDPAVVPFPGAAGPEVRTMLQHGIPGGPVWRPGEADVSIRPGWFWHPKEDARIRSVENLVDLYFKSVGRNSLLLLNVPANNRGLLPDGDVRRLAEFRARLDQIFKTDLAIGRHAAASNVRGGDELFAAAKALDGSPDSYWATEDEVMTGWLEVDLGRPGRFNIAAIQEAIALGQRVESHRIEYFDGAEWKPIIGGTTIGHKRLHRFEPVTAQRVRLVIEKALACPTISVFGLYLDE